jgi:hypothetical protein
LDGWREAHPGVGGIDYYGAFNTLILESFFEMNFCVGLHKGGCWNEKRKRYGVTI